MLTWFSPKEPCFLLPETLSHYLDSCNKLRETMKEDCVSIRFAAVMLESKAISMGLEAEASETPESASRAKKELARRKIRTLTEEAKKLRGRAKRMRKLAKWLERRSRTFFPGALVLSEEILPLTDTNYRPIKEVAERKARYQEWEKICDTGEHVLSGTKNDPDGRFRTERRIVRCYGQFFLCEIRTPKGGGESWIQFVTDSVASMNDEELQAIVANS